MRSGLFTAFTLSLLLPMVAGAQSLGGLGGISGDVFSLSANPQYPAPYSKATISVFSGSINVTNTTITALVDNKEVYRGSARPFPVQLGKSGSVTNVKVMVSYGGVNYSRELFIQPQDVVAVAEPISSSPPLYQGKSLVPLDGSVRVVAVANLKDSDGKTSSPSAYSYLWTIDGTQIANSSGIGKSTIIVASPLQYRARKVSVVVTNPVDGLVGGAEISLSAMEPSVRIYENDSLLGIRYERAISGSYAINGSEATLYAAPFSLPATNGQPSIQWFLNGDLAQSDKLITLRPTGRGNGNASLSLVASAGNFSRATEELSVSFGENSGTNFFGL